MPEERGDEDLSVACPICKGKLKVDRETGVVIESRRAGRGGKDFEQILGDVMNAGSENESKFKNAFKAESKRVDLLEKKFESARQRAERSEDSDGESGGS